MRSGNLTDFWCTIDGCTKSKHTSQVLVQGRAQGYSDSCIFIRRRQMLLWALLPAATLSRHPCRLKGILFNILHTDFGEYPF